MIRSKTVLVWSRLEICVDSEQNQRLQYFRGWAGKRDRSIRSSYGGVLARFRYWDDDHHHRVAKHPFLFLNTVLRNIIELLKVIEYVGMCKKRASQRGPTEGVFSMAVPAMSTRPRTSALRISSTHPAISNANHK